MPLSDRDARVLTLATRIGYICRHIRLQQCMTIAELSEKIGLPERSLRTLERGEGIHQTIDVMAVVAWGLGFEWDLAAKDAQHKYTASGIETEGHDPAEGHGAKHESPTAEGRDAHNA